MMLLKNGLAVAAFALLLTFFACQKDSSTTGTGTSTVALDETRTVTSVLAKNGATHDDPTDYFWDAATEISIILNGSTITSNSALVNILGSKAIISAAGNFRISGNLTDGQIIVASADAAPVRLILDNATIKNTSSSALFISKSSKTIIILADGSVNKLADGSTYIFPTAGETEPNATIFSKSNLTITGGGSLEIDANFGDAITSKDGLIVAGGAQILIDAKDDGLRGKEFLVIKNASITATTGGDGLKSDNDSLPNFGFVHIIDGVFELNSKADAVQAATDLLIEKGNFTITTGGGSAATLAATATAKGLKSANILVIDGGDFTFSTADDAIHSNANATINGGKFTISTKDDGLHADSTVVINGGDITVLKSFEGIEGMVVAINGGTTRIFSTDDGINCSDLTVNQSGSRPPANPNFYLKITGGFVYINSSGDGLDSNGSMFQSGGSVIVEGPTKQGNGAIDYDLAFETTGGTVSAVGTAGMAQVPGGASSSTQNAVFINFSSAQSAGQIVRLESAAGETIIALQPSKTYQTLGFSSAKLEKGATFKIIVGGSSTVAAADGLIEDATFSGGSELKTFTVSGLVTTVN